MVWVVVPVTEAKEERGRFVTWIEGMRADKCAIFEGPWDGAVWEAARPSALDQWGWS